MRNTVLVEHETAVSRPRETSMATPYRSMPAACARVLAGALACLAVVGAWTLTAAAQAGGQAVGQAAAAAPPARAAAPIDLTGQWVSLVTDDWRWRMVTPPKGDVLYLPVNDAGRRMAEQWDPAADAAAGEACRAYGAGGILHQPGRLRISWQDDNTLKLETDTGQQTRLFNFANVPPPAESSWQGFSRAVWELPGGARGRGRGAAGPRAGSSMRVTTNRMRLGYYRRNGVPYGPNATMTEWFAVLTEPDGNTYLVVTKILEDAQYLTGPYVRTVQFKKETSQAGWNPIPCM
jgi:hypothetical protein